MNAKFSLALIALIGIGVFALPSTVALFAGQHSFYNIDATGNQIPCAKCHGDVQSELTTTGYSATAGTRGPHADFKCEYCHRAESGFASGDDAAAKLTYAAVAPATGQIALVTTINNYETGNFPKNITYRDGMTVDNWNATPSDIQNLDGSDFEELEGLRNVYGAYQGSLTTLGQVGVKYSFTGASETALYSSGVPKDTNPSTMTGAFNARGVTWNSATAENYFGAGSREVTAGTKYHAASLVSCLECHGGEKETGNGEYAIESAAPYNHEGWVQASCADCHYGSGLNRERSLAAGGFGLTSFGEGLDTGETEAHNAWVKTPEMMQNNNNKNLSRFGYGAANNACIACHTHVAVQINFKKGYLLQFDAVENVYGDYTVSNWAVMGKVNITTYGNGSGNTFAVSNDTITWNPNMTLYINGGTYIVQPLNNAIDDSAKSLNPAYSTSVTSGALTGTGSVKNIILSPLTKSVFNGSSVVFTASVYNMTDKLMPNTVTWSKDSALIGTLNPTGTQTALLNIGVSAVPGIYNITANVGNVSTNATVTVVSGVPILSNIVLTSATGVYYVPPLVTGQQATITASARDQNDNSFGGVTYAFTNSNNTVGTIALQASTSARVFTAKAAGTTWVNVTGGGLSNSTLVTVVGPGFGPSTLSTISITPGNASIPNGTTLYPFNATGIDQYGTPIWGPLGNKTTWSITNSTVGTFNATGYFNATKVGTANIIAVNTTTGISGITSITVT